MDYNTKSALIKALNDKFVSDANGVNDESTRYDPNTGTIYSNTGHYGIADLESAREKVAEFSKKCTSLNPTLVLNPSYIKIANLIDAVLLLCEMELKAKQKAPGEHLTP